MAKIGLNNFRYGKLTELPDGSFSYADAKSPGIVAWHKEALKNGLIAGANAT